MASPPSSGSMPNRFSALNCARESTTSAPLYPSPHLHTLTIASPSDDFTSPVDDFTSEDDSMVNTYTFSFAYIIGLLHLTPNLVECTFYSISMYPPATVPPPLVLPHLRYLKFVGAEVTNVSDHVLNHLSLPALETLDNPLSYYHDHNGPSVNEFSRFLRRSSPPLQRLSLGRRFVNVPFPQLEAWLRLVPSVIDLELYTAKSIFAADLFSALAESPPDLLPNLQSLRIRHHWPIHRWPAPGISAYPALLRTLSVRSAQIVCFHLRFRSAADKPDPDVCDGLRQLAADGMDIYIGSADYEQNYISL
ncbi:F-box domain-containing protein [Mycena venus]|uniref:F-box domain-containing protein n=1 Tax=Mycena venus TaxID=2733690 RepID=A0A8H6XBE2_9AGAR|nr:F-box domain-containing protein [Mycena venus]